MAIFINEHTHVLVQGITGRQGRFHSRQMLNYGSKIVAGVSPAKGGETVEGIPVYRRVGEALEHHFIDASIIFVPAVFAKDCVYEAVDEGIKLLVLITEHIPLHDMMAMIAYARSKGTMIVGPNTFGLISSGKCKIGIMPNQIFLPGEIGVVARSGTLSYEVVSALKEKGLGTTTVVGIGGDRVLGLNYIQVLAEFEQDPDTKGIVLVGEIGGRGEEEAARFIQNHVSKSVVAYIAGKSVPNGKRMGHAGAIIERGVGSYESKRGAFEAVGVPVAKFPFEVPELFQKLRSF